MSSANSNLSDLGYDLVVGLTQNSMNSTMKRYLSAMDVDLPPACYVFTDGSLTSVELIAYDDLLALTNGVDPFSIPDGTTSDTSDEAILEAGNALYNALFAFGFKSSMGLPSLNAPDILTLQDSNSSQRVWYNMYFKTFQIVSQVGGRGGYWTFQNDTQDPNDPWVYLWEVGLDLQSADFSSLPQATQNAIKNLDNASMFSVQQLLLDLNTAPTYAAQQPQENTEFDSNILLTDYLGGYWDALRNIGGAVFAQAVQPTDSDPNPAEPSLIPTDLNFIVSPYTPDPADGDLSPEQQNGLYTLNYLIMAGNPMPNPITAPDWNWLSATEDQTYDGVMSVRKGDFVNYLKGVLNPALSDICIQPTVDMDADWKLYVTYTWGQKAPNPMPTYSVVNNASDPTHILTASYASNKQDDKDNPGYDIIAVIGDTLIWSQVSSDVYISGNTITCITTASVYLDVGLAGIAGADLSHTRGYVYATTNTTTFTLGVTTNGQLSVDMAPPQNQDLRQTSNSSGAWYSGDLDASFFAQMATMGDMQDMVDSIQSYYMNLMSSYMSNFNNDIKNMLNNLNAWVFPGADSFTYAKCSFSDYQDLLTMVTYVDVS